MPTCACMCSHVREKKKKRFFDREREKYFSYISCISFFRIFIHFLSICVLSIISSGNPLLPTISRAWTPNDDARDAISLFYAHVPRLVWEVTPAAILSDKRTDGTRTDKREIFQVWRRRRKCWRWLLHSEEMENFEQCGRSRRGTDDVISTRVDDKNSCVNGSQWNGSRISGENCSIGQKWFLGIAKLTENSCWFRFAIVIFINVIFPKIFYIWNNSAYISKYFHRTHDLGLIEKITYNFNFSPNSYQNKYIENNSIRLYFRV